MTNVVCIVPAYNEASRLADVVQSAQKYVHEIIVVDDGSTDDTYEVATAQGVKVVRHMENCGSGAATMTGIFAARMIKADAIILIDGDGQHDANDIPRLLEPILDKKADIVFANRFGQKNRIPFIRRLFNWIGNMLTFFVTGAWVPDSQCCFKALGARALQEVDIQMSGYEFCTEIVREAVTRRWQIAQIPISVTYSEYTLAKGQSFAGGVKTAGKILLQSLLR